MKLTFVMALFTLILSNVSFAEGQTDTDCIAMREDNSREVVQKKGKDKEKSDVKVIGSQAVSQ